MVFWSCCGGFLRILSCFCSKVMQVRDEDDLRQPACSSRLTPSTSTSCSSRLVGAWSLFWKISISQLGDLFTPQRVRVNGLDLPKAKTPKYTKITRQQPAKIFSKSLHDHQAFCFFRVSLQTIWTSNQHLSRFRREEGVNPGVVSHVQKAF